MVPAGAGGVSRSDRRFECRRRCPDSRCRWGRLATRRSLACSRLSRRHHARRPGRGSLPGQTAPGASGRFASWVASDVTSFVAAQDFDHWHDRVAFQFLTEDDDGESYRDAMTGALRPGAQAVLATFSVDGSAKCSGLDVRRYTVESLGLELGLSLELVDSRRHLHTTPGGGVEEFVFGRLVRVPI